MIIVLRPEASPDSASRILSRISEAGLTPLHMPGSERVVIGALGDERVLAELQLESDPMVESVKPILAPYKLVSRELHPHDTIVRIGGMAIGGSGRHAASLSFSAASEGSRSGNASSLS